MSYEFYKIVHVIGAIILFLGLGAGISRRYLAGEATSLQKYGSISHGIGLLLLFVAGFGLLAKLKVGFPVWVFLKIVIWLLLGAIIVLFRKSAIATLALWLTIIVLGSLSVYLAIVKPF
jgi:hypothetical protein